MQIRDAVCPLLLDGQIAGNQADRDPGIGKGIGKRGGGVLQGVCAVRNDNAVKAGVQARANARAQGVNGRAGVVFAKGRIGAFGLKFKINAVFFAVAFQQKIGLFAVGADKATVNGAADRAAGKQE